MVFAIAVAVAAGVILADADRGDHALAFAHVDDAHAARGTSRDANSVHRTADQGAAVRHQHDLVAVGDTDRGDDPAAVRQPHQLDALAAASGDPVLVGRGAL